MEQKKIKRIPADQCVGKHCLYGQPANEYNTTLIQVTEMDLVEVRNDWMNVNIYRDTGDIQNHWLSKHFFPIVEVLGEAIHKVPVFRNTGSEDKTRHIISGEEL